jgi:hypothetical protein
VPEYARFLRRLASFSRLIVFDKRGTGLSDRVSNDRLPTLEQRMDDVRAVLQAAGSARAAVFGALKRGNMTYSRRDLPRTRPRAGVGGGLCEACVEPDYPWAPTPAQRARVRGARA